MPNVPASLTSVSPQTYECNVSLSNVNVNEARDAASAVKFNAGELKSAASQNFKACAAEHGSKFNSNESDSNKSQKPRTMKFALAARNLASKDTADSAYIT